MKGYTITHRLTEGAAPGQHPYYQRTAVPHTPPYCTTATAWLSFFTIILARSALFM